MSANTEGKTPGFVPPFKVQLHVEGERGVLMTLPPAPRVLVGRTDDDSQTDLGIDLAPLGGASKGVSRIHAAFFYQDNLLHVEDLESTNGTRINGMTLLPNKPYRLRDGDELEFGSARLIVRLR
jgi:hypothetical protein